MTQPMNILFLDLDGVMVLQSSSIKNQPQSPYRTEFSKVAIAALQSILDQCRPHIVLTSSWRYQGLEAMQQLWQDHHLPGQIYDITSLHVADEAIMQGATSAQCRAIEIKDWLQRHPYSYKYAILDDEPITDSALDAHVITIDPAKGLNWDKAGEVIHLFHRTPYQAMEFSFWKNNSQEYNVSHIAEAIHQEWTYSQNTCSHLGNGDMGFIIEHTVNLAKHDERLALCYGLGALILLQTDSDYRQRQYGELCGLLCDIAIHLRERELAKMLLRVADGLVYYMFDYSYEDIDKSYNRLVKLIDDMHESEVVDNRLWYMEVLLELRRHWALTEQERYYIYDDRDDRNEPFPMVGVQYFSDEKEIARGDEQCAIINLHQHPLTIDELIEQIKKISLMDSIFIIDDLQSIKNPDNKPIKLMLEEFAYGTRIQMFVKFTPQNNA